MTQNPDLSPRAQAILRAIENEAQARREATDRVNLPGAYTPPTAPVPPMPAPLAAPAGVTPAEPLGEAADRLMRLVDHVVAQTEGVRARVKEVEESLDLLSDKLAQPTTLKPAEPQTLKPAVPAERRAPAVAEPAPAAPPPPVPTAVAPTPPGAPASESDGARLMAIEMAVSGSSRGEVGDRLAHDFGVADPTPFLDDVFGAGSADDSRMPWTS